MDATDLLDITAGLLEVTDQTCMIGSHGPFDCLVLPETGTAAQGSVATDLAGFWRVLIHPDCEPYLKRGARIVGSRGMDAIINGHDAGRSIHGYNEVLATREVSSIPFPGGDPEQTTTVMRWNGATLAWDSLEIPDVQVSEPVYKEVVDKRTGITRMVAVIEATSPNTATDIQVGDRIAVENGIATIVAVRRNDQFEADGEVVANG